MFFTVYLTFWTLTSSPTMYFSSLVQIPITWQKTKGKQKANDKYPSALLVLHNLSSFGNKDFIISHPSQNDSEAPVIVISLSSLWWSGPHTRSATLCSLPQPRWTVSSYFPRWAPTPPSIPWTLFPTLHFPNVYFFCKIWLKHPVFQEKRQTLQTEKILLSLFQYLPLS